MPKSPYRLGVLAELVGGVLRGDPERCIEGVRTLEEAGPGDLAFLTHARYRSAAVASRAGALLLSPEAAEDASFAGRDLVIAPRPDLALARLLAALYPSPPAAPGVHPTAVVGEGCKLAPDAAVGAYAVIGEGSRLGPGVAVGPLAVVGRGCTLGAGSVLHPHAVLYDGTELGAGVVVHAGVVLGCDGFGYVTTAEGHVKVPQVGKVVVEDGVEIGANSAVDRATLGETRIGAGSKLDNLVQVGHNVRVGRKSILCGQAGVAGSTRLGEGVVLAGQAGVAGHLEVGDGVQVAAKSALLQAAEAGQMAGIPAVPIARWRRQTAAGARLGEALRRLRALEARLAALEERLVEED